MCLCVRVYVCAIVEEKGSMKIFVSKEFKMRLRTQRTTKSATICLEREEEAEILRPIICAFRPQDGRLQSCRQFRIFF